MFFLPFSSSGITHDLQMWKYDWKVMTRRTENHAEPTKLYRISIAYKWNWTTNQTVNRILFLNEKNRKHWNIVNDLLISVAKKKSEKRKIGIIMVFLKKTEKGRDESERKKITKRNRKWQEKIENNIQKKKWMKPANKQLVTRLRSYYFL